MKIFWDMLQIEFRGGILLLDARKLTIVRENYIKFVDQTFTAYDETY